MFLDRCCILSDIARNIIKQQHTNKAKIIKGRWYPQIYTSDPRTCAILILAWGSNWGPSRFSCNQINRGSSGAYVTYMYCGLSVKTKVAWRSKIVSAFALHLFLRVWSAKTWRPQIEPHGWQCHYMGRYRRSGISGVYLWGYPRSIRTFTSRFLWLHRSHTVHYHWGCYKLEVAARDIWGYSAATASLSSSCWNQGSKYMGAKGNFPPIFTK